MPNEWLAPQEAAELLGCSAETVRAMLDDGLFSGKKVKNEWWVNAVEVEWIQSIKPSAPLLAPPASSSLLEVEPGMVEVSIALSGIATAIASILPSMPTTTENLRSFVVPFVALLAGILAVFSAYSSLWLLARYCLGEPRSSSIEEIWTLLRRPVEVGPYWILALALSVWTGLSILIFASTVCDLVS